MQVESRLVGAVEARPFLRILRLVSKRIRDPCLSVVASLKLDLITRGRHNGEESVSVRDTKRLQQPVGKREKGIRPTEDKRHDGSVERDAENDGFGVPINPGPLGIGARY